MSDVSVTNRSTLSWRLAGLSPSTKYKFYAKACTAKGCGKAATEEGLTLAQGSKFTQSALVWRSSTSRGKICRE